MKIVIERHPDGYVAYPLGIKSVVVGQGDTYVEAMADVTSAMRFHIQTFGREALGIVEFRYNRIAGLESLLEF